MSNAAEAAAGPVVEKFAASVGRWLGYCGIAFGVAVAVAVFFDHPSRNWQVAAFGIGVAALSWLILVRPSVSLHEHGVLLRNMVRDTFVPSSKIDRCKTAQTLMIRAGADTFHGLGVSRSARSLMREKRGARPGVMGSLGNIPASFGAGAIDDPSETSRRRYATEEVQGPTYQEYVESRIERAAHDARPDDREPVVVWAPPALVVLAAASLCLVSLFF
jgi:hypothetical protein